MHTLGSKIKKGYCQTTVSLNFLFLRAALRNAPTDVTSTVNSAQAPSRHTRGSA